MHIVLEIVITEDYTHLNILCQLHTRTDAALSRYVPVKLPFYGYTAVLHYENFLWLPSVLLHIPCYDGEEVSGGVVDASQVSWWMSGLVMMCEGVAVQDVLCGCFVEDEGRIVLECFIWGMEVVLDSSGFDGLFELCKCDAVWE